MNKINDSKRIVYLLVLSVVLGLVVGVGFSGKVDNTSEISLYLKSLYNSQIYSGQLKKFVFLKAMLSYGKYIIFLWFMAFIKFGWVWSTICLFFKGMSIGFTSAVLSYTNYADRVFVLFKYFGLQTLLFLPTIVIISYFSIYYASSQKLGAKKIKGGTLLEYGLILLLGMSMVILISFLEGYVVSGYVY